MTTRKITLELTQEQKDAVLHFINFNNWTVNVEENERPEEVDEVPYGDVHFPLPSHREGEAECPDCFCAPCVVHENNRQLWWPERNQDPKCVNGTQRRRLYQRFWSVMKNCGAWEDPRYLSKKVQAGGRSFAVHRREIMPDCVVRQCRQWLPNPDKIPYMGHKWQ